MAQRLLGYEHELLVQTLVWIVEGRLEIEPNPSKGRIVTRSKVSLPSLGCGRAMQERFYDVVVVGRSIGALVAAALLARHDFTVLVVGQGQKPCDYEFEEHRLRRRAFLMLAGQSAAWSNVM